MNWDWNAIYLTCFGVGLVLTLLAFVAGGLHLHIGHWHFGANYNAHHGSHAGKGSASFFNGFTLVAFLCWFGGTGYLLHRMNVFGGLAVLGISALSGLAGASLIFWFLVGVLLPAEKTLEPEDTELTGMIGKLSAAVPKGGVGEMLYQQNGSRRSAAVRADDGAEIERGAEVVVMRYTRGIAYVKRWDEFEHGLMGESPNQTTTDSAHDR